jgi:hypothetical protein
MNIDKELDARGLNCPLPILRTKKALAEISAGGEFVFLMRKTLNQIVHWDARHVGAPPPARIQPQIAANPHPNLPPQAGEGAIVSPPACGRGLRGGLAPLPQRCFGSNGQYGINP